MKKSKEQYILYEKNIFKGFILLAIPVCLANLLKSFHDFVDTYFIGQMENSTYAQAGISVSWPFLNLFIAFSIGLAVAGVAIISQYLGAGKKEKAQKYSGILFTLTVILGAIINALVFFLSPVILKWMKADPNTYENALIYLRIRSFEMIPLFMFTSFQAIRQSEGDTTTPVLLSVTSVLINILLTWLFIDKLNMKIEGAALSTLIGQLAILPIILYLLFSKKQSLHITLKDLKLDSYCVKKIIRVASPSALAQGIPALGFLVLQSIILSYGAQVSAGFSIGNKISNMLLLPVMAFGSVLAAYVGQNIGHGNPDRAKRTYVISRRLSFWSMVVGAAILMPLRRPVLGLLTNDPNTLDIACEYAIWCLLTQPLMGLFQNYLGVFNGCGETKFAFIYTMVRLWVIRLPLIEFLKYFTKCLHTSLYYGNKIPDFFLSKVTYTLGSIGRAGIWYAMVISNVLILFLGEYLYKKLDFSPKLSKGTGK